MAEEEQGSAASPSPQPSGNGDSPKPAFPELSIQNAIKMNLFWMNDFLGSEPALPRWVAVWMGIQSVSTIALCVAPLFYGEQYYLITVIVIIPFLLGVVALFYYYRLYGGWTKAVGLPHLLFPIGGIVPDLIAITSSAFGPRVSPSNKPALFVIIIVQLSAMILCFIFDFIDAVIWHIKQDRAVLRGTKMLSFLKGQGRLKADVDKVQTLMVAGQSQLSGDLNEYGLLN